MEIKYGIRRTKMSHQAPSFFLFCSFYIFGIAPGIFGPLCHATLSGSLAYSIQLITNEITMVRLSPCPPPWRSSELLLLLPAKCHLPLSFSFRFHVSLGRPSLRAALFTPFTPFGPSPCPCNKAKRLRMRASHSATMHCGKMVQWPLIINIFF